MSDQKQRRRVLMASLVGNSIEWFDYFLYSTAAGLVFNQLFFPKSMDPLVALMASYLTLALTFVFRPLGGILFAHIGDRIGRKKTLVMTLMLMGCSTVLIGLLPTYEQIGIWAPILLIILRIIQGFGIGGEWGGALLIAVEHAEGKRRAFFGSVPQMGIPIGLLLGTFSLSVMSMVTTEEQFLSWGWRVPFILSIVLVLLGLWLRKGIDESPIFKEAQEQGKVVRIPILETLCNYWKETLISVGLKVVETAPFYIFGTFVVSYATLQGYSKSTALNAVAIASLVTAILIPYMGILGDRIGRKPLYIAGTIGIILFAFPYFWMIHGKSDLLLILATIIGLGILWTPVTAVLGTLYSEIFSTQVRYTGATLGYQIGAAVAGGTAPFIATALLGTFNSWIPIAIYLVLTSLISLLSIVSVRETKDSSLN
ncbi:MFS transporter [Calditerricola satsumensis]|uniref:Putative proline/betaine transporter n=1 Tax=Calditerricola satsumensis TaxID=373054 RepID=A0A8J3BG05_9BACI|nr:MFS transporter [Calditerricola satsumensis]GGK04815.1 MFS transporter [Calditerricola satsumensis]